MFTRRGDLMCSPLASTGQPVLVVVATAAVLLIAGLTLMFLIRSRRHGRSAVILALGLVAGLAVLTTASSSAWADTSWCTGSPDPGRQPGTPTRNSPGEPALAIRQTSVMAGLAPGVAPVVIAGIVTNRGTARTLVSAVSVKISGVIPASGASPGSCDATDYLLFEETMPVGRTLGPGESSAFAGARIGFSNKTTEQDACQRAVVKLSYVSS